MTQDQDKLQKAALMHQEAITLVREVLAGYTDRCHPDCKGWCVGEEGVERCDDCAHTNEVDEFLTDELCALLPEALEMERDAWTP